MVLGPFAFACLLLLPLLFGAGLLRLVGVTPRTDALAYPAWAWIVGTLATAALLFVWLWFGLAPDHLRALQLALLVLGAGGLVVGRRRPALVDERASTAGAPGWERLLFWGVLAALLALVAVRVLVASRHVMVINDEAGFWSFKAKVLWHTGGFNEHYGPTIERHRMPHGDYPLYNPLLQLWTYLHAGRITHAVNRVPIQVFAFATVLLLAASLRRVVRPALAALLLVLFASCFHARFAARYAYSDLLFGTGLLLAFDAWWRWRRGGPNGWLGLAALGLASATWSKHEGQVFLVALALAAATFLTSRARLAAALRPTPAKLWVLLPVLPVAATWFVNRLIAAKSVVMTGLKTGEPFPLVFARQLDDRTPVVVAHFWREVVVEPSHSQLVFAAFLLLLCAFPRSTLKSDLRLPTLALALTFLGYVLVFIGIPDELNRYLNTSVGRVVFQLVPGAVLWVAIRLALLEPRLGRGA